ncbi:hypothetical protein GGS21DRAFT_517607 [Xylaria nigripes]|nr:hypothetical protein GGS21DRAFT_517607 [Xylaria nigripes]
MAEATASSTIYRGGGGGGGNSRGRRGSGWGGGGGGGRGGGRAGGGRGGGWGRGTSRGGRGRGTSRGGRGGGGASGRRRGPDDSQTTWRGGNQRAMDEHDDVFDHSRLLSRSGVKKSFYVKKNKNMYRVEQVQFADAADAAYADRAMQQELAEREDYAKLKAREIVDWEDLDADSDRDDDEDQDDPILPAEIDAPDERRRQIEGYKAELFFNWMKTLRVDNSLGKGELGRFRRSSKAVSEESDQAPAPRVDAPDEKTVPEYSPSKRRNNLYAESVKMNYMIGVDSLRLSDAIAAF